MTRHGRACPGPHACACPLCDPGPGLHRWPLSPGILLQSFHKAAWLNPSACALREGSPAMLQQSKVSGATEPRCNWNCLACLYHLFCLSHGKHIRCSALSRMGGTQALRLYAIMRHCMRCGHEPTGIPSAFLRSSYDSGGSSWERSSSTVGIACGFLVGVMTAVFSLSSEPSSSLTVYVWAMGDAKGLYTPCTDKKHSSGTLGGGARYNKGPLLQTPVHAFTTMHTTASLLQDPFVAPMQGPNCKNR